jgi:Ca2+-transporting ATPase
VVQAIHTVVAGRTRYRVSGLYRSERFKRVIEEALSGHDRVRSVSASILTGNVLVVYDHQEGFPADAVARVIERAVKDHGGNGHGSHGGTSALTPVSPSGFSREALRRPARSAPAQPTRRQLRLQVKHAEVQIEEQWHLRSAQSVLDHFGISKRSGLTAEGAKASLARFGPNVLPEAVPRSGWSIFIEQFKSLPVGLLGVAAGISAVTGGLIDALVILGVVAINAAIGYVTESQSERTIHSLKTLTRPLASVVRDGAVQTVGAEHVTPGDLLVLRPGSYIAADARLIEVEHLSVDESALTGESLPVQKTLAPLMTPVVPLADRTCMVYRGTLVTGGQGLAIVVATGRFTEIGRIQSLMGEARSPETPMERQLDQIGNQLVLICGAVCGVVFVVGLLRGYGVLQMLKTSISLAVAAVPEGLPAVATTTLALGIQRMRKLNVLIRHLDAVETLGAVQTICMDKTGTITLNRMTVMAVLAGADRLAFRNGTFRSNGRVVHPDESEELLRLLHIGALCSETAVSRQEGEYVLQGSSTENALVQMALSSGVDVMGLRTRYPLSTITHRSEQRNYMSTVHAAGNGARLVAVKGSPNEVLELCGWHLRGGVRLPLDGDARASLESENERMAGDALRMLGVAYALQEEGSPEGVRSGDLIWLGLVGMADAMRGGMPQLVDSFHRAGIDTVMITGDQSPTAYAIGKELNLSRGEELEILDSTNLSQVAPDVMKALAGRVHVFARVSPAHKLQIVQALQAAGRVVAMTGDGINDGPALKAADIGIAMGHTGTDVAREVADVVLEDDNLETMIIAISQGRTIYNNIRKSVRFLLATNMSEIIVMFTALAAGLGQPLTVMQLLWINLLSDIFPALALALEPPEPDILSRPPRDPNEPIIQSSDLKRIVVESSVISAGSLAAYGYGMVRYGAGPQAGSLAFLSLVSGQLLHAVSCRSDTHTIFDRGSLAPNPYLTAALGGSFALQALTVFVPGFRTFLGIAPPSFLDLAVVGGASILPLLINESTKRPRLPAPTGAKPTADPPCGTQRAGSTIACTVCGQCAADPAR